MIVGFVLYPIVYYLLSESLGQYLHPVFEWATLLIKHSMENIDKL